jgi:hypothetical protein
MPVYFWWMLFAVIYLLAGQIFCLNYIMGVNSAERNVWIGIMGLFWPILLIIDVVLQIAGGLGKYTHMVRKKIDQ